MVQCSIILPSIILFSIFLVLYAPVVKTRFAGVSYHEVQSTSERVSGYEEAMTLFRSRPILGVGAGNYTRAAYALHPDRPGWEYQPVHSVPLLMLVELGSLGVLLFLLMIVSFLRFQEVYARGRVQYIFLSVLVFLPVLLLDHYLFSSYIGLLLVAITCGFAVKARV
jgi:O-antigen ligase